MAKYCPYCVSRIESGESCPYCSFAYTYKMKPHHLRPGTLLNNKYLIGRVLGEGGFGITYVGRDLTLDMKVAIKEYYPAGSAARISSHSTEISLVDMGQSLAYTKGRAQFIYEAQTIAKMDKESAVVTVRDFFETNNSAYIVMEFIEGQDLRDMISSQGKPMDKKTLLPMLEPIFGALSEMHKIGLIHRDISPDNIMVENGRARLIDFGCTTKTVDMSGADKVLKHCFSPIEQYENSDMGPWSDVYAMAATIYYCLTGKLPPNAMERAQKDTLVPPSALGVKLLPKQERALLKALSVDKDGRYQSMGDFGKAFFVHTNLYKYIALAACGVAVIALGAILLVKANSVKSLPVRYPVDVALTAEDSLNADEKDMLQKMTELASSASLVKQGAEDVLTFVNDAGCAFEYLDIYVRYLDDKGTIKNCMNAYTSDVGDGISFESTLYAGNANANSVEVKIVYPYQEKVYSTAYVPLIDGKGKEAAIGIDVKVVNTLPQSLDSNIYDDINTYLVSDIVIDTTSYYYVGITISGSMARSTTGNNGYIGFRISNSNGAIVGSGEIQLPVLNAGDRFIIYPNCYGDFTYGESYSIEFTNFEL